MKVTPGVSDDAKCRCEGDAAPLSPFAYCRQAEALDQEGHYEEAIASYDRALALAPGDNEALLGQARVYQWRLDSPLPARAIYLQMVRNAARSPAFHIAYAALAQTFLGDVGLENARREFLELIPSEHQAVGLRALLFALVRVGRYDEATALGSELLASRPDDVELLVVLAQIATEQRHDLVAAEACYQRALNIDPQNQAVLNGWLLHLIRVGEPEHGYEFARNAVKAPRYASQRSGGTPLWDGSNPRGKNMIVDGWMGFGDCVQFSRVAAVLHDAGATVTVTCRPKVQRLIQTVPGVDRVITPAEQQPGDGYVTPFLGCSLIQRSPAALGALVPYLTADADAVARWKSLLPKTYNLKVGLTWLSNALVDRTNRHTFRSMTFSDIAPLVDVPGIDFYSLQCGTVPRQELATAQVSHRVRDVAERLTDFMETAAAMMAMDLIITVDTAAAHVAGALGRPTFVLLPYTPSFRWPLNRRDYPWYPTMRTFSQSRPGVWTDPVGDVREELSELARSWVACSSPAATLMAPFAPWQSSQESC